MKGSQKFQGNMIMLVAIIIFGLNIPATKYLYSEGLANPFQITMLRVSFAAITFWLTSLFLPSQKVERKDLIILFFGGVCGIILNQGLFAIGLQHTSPVDASIITTSGPLFALIIGAIILKEPITWMKFGGIIVGGLGAIFLIYNSNHAETAGSSDFIGNLCIIVAQFFYAFYLVITRPLSTKYSPVTINKWVFLFASLAFLPFSAKDVVQTPLFYQTDSTPFFILAFILCGATYITFMLIPLAQQRIRATTISMYNNLQPVIASLVAIYMGMDQFTIEKLLACLIIFLGVYLVTKSKSKVDMDKEEALSKK